jgi:hypothetical protein
MDGGHTDGGWRVLSGSMELSVKNPRACGEVEKDLDCFEN